MSRAGRGGTGGRGRRVEGRGEAEQERCLRGSEVLGHVRHQRTPHPLPTAAARAAEAGVVGESDSGAGSRGGAGAGGGAHGSEVTVARQIRHVAGPAPARRHQRNRV